MAWRAIISLRPAGAMVPLCNSFASAITDFDVFWNIYGRISVSEQACADHEAATVE